MADLKIKVVIDNSRKVTQDQLCKCLTGLDIKSLAEAIASNVDGKYDALYES